MMSTHATLTELYILIKSQVIARHNLMKFQVKSELLEQTTIAPFKLLIQWDGIHV